MFENLERQSLKRNRSVVFSEPPASAPASAPASSSIASSDFANAVAPDFTGHVSERLVQILTTMRTSPEALFAVFDELNAMPHVPIQATSNPREIEIRHMILLDARCSRPPRRRTPRPGTPGSAPRGSKSAKITLLCLMIRRRVIATVYPEVYPSDMPPILARLEPSHVYIRPH
jgi:hypothetical protein